MCQLECALPPPRRCRPGVIRTPHYAPTIFILAFITTADFTLPAMEKIILSVRQKYAIHPPKLLLWKAGGLRTYSVRCGGPMLYPLSAPQVMVPGRIFYLWTITPNGTITAQPQVRLLTLPENISFQRISYIPANNLKHKLII